MTVIFSKKCEYGLQAVLFLATKYKDGIVSSDEIAKKLDIPKEFVSKILQSLVISGLVNSRKGKNGGFTLANSPKKIKLIDIVESIDGLDLFNTCVLGFLKCNSQHPCPVHDKWGKLRTEAFEMLSGETLEDLNEKTVKKLKSL